VYSMIISMQTHLQKIFTEQASGGPHGSHAIYWVPIAVFNDLPITLWKHNRPPDAGRVAEIHAYMTESKRMDGIIHLAFVNNQLVCYESNHRREALKGLTDMAHILVDVMWEATDELVKQEFFRLNKSVSVPELFVTPDAGETLIAEVRDAVEGFCRNYPSLRTSTARPQRPNFNRDMLTDEFYRVMRENDIGVKELGDRLMRLNRAMSQRDRRRLSEKVIAKCQATDLWLFAWSATLNAKELE
jgi:hypothetical protein